MSSNKKLLRSKSFKLLYENCLPILEIDGKSNLSLFKEQAHLAKYWEKYVKKCQQKYKIEPSNFP